MPEISSYNHKDLFAVRVLDGSMDPTLTEGDVVIFAREGEPESGKIVAVHVPGDELIIKRLQKVGDTWLLVSNNPAHPPRPLREGKQILGWLKWQYRRCEEVPEMQVNIQERGAQK